MGKHLKELVFFATFLKESHSSRTLAEILTAGLLLTHCILVDSSTVICWMSPYVVLGVSCLFCPFHSICDGKFC